MVTLVMVGGEGAQDVLMPHSFLIRFLVYLASGLIPSRLQADSGPNRFFDLRPPTSPTVLHYTALSFFSYRGTAATSCSLMTSCLTLGVCCHGRMCLPHASLTAIAWSSPSAAASSTLFCRVVSAGWIYAGPIADPTRCVRGWLEVLTDRVV